MKKILYLDCCSGISGDMTVGALLDLGASRQVLEQALESLGVSGYHLHFGRKKKCGIDAYDFDVHLEADGHSHENQGLGGLNNHNVHSHHEPIHAHEDSHSQGHDHHHEHSHAHNHEHPHAHNHEHRNLHDIHEIINRLKSNESVKEFARQVFDIVAEAESKAHGISVEEVHFHEVGAIDSIVDIISVAVCLDDLGIDQVIVSPLAEGRGYVKCQHGIMPVPVPATANIAAAHGLELKLTDNEGEMVTPTGAAIAAALSKGHTLPTNYKIERIGIGAGNKDFPNANILRAMLIRPVNQQESADNRLWILETNIDDCSGEALGFTMDILLEAGVNDVWFSPVFMKKNRPAYQLSVLCKGEILELVQDIILTQTTTIGIRRYPVERTVMDRRQAEVETPFGMALVKVCTHKGKTFCYPENDSIQAICRQHQMDFGTVYHMVLEAALYHAKQSSRGNVYDLHQVEE